MRMGVIERRKPFTGQEEDQGIILSAADSTKTWHPFPQKSSSSSSSTQRRGRPPLQLCFSNSAVWVLLLVGSGFFVGGTFWRLFVVDVVGESSTARDGIPSIDSVLLRKNNEINNPHGRHGGSCRGYKGILHISQGDVEGAAGTIFFLFVFNQILYAEKHNLMPWIHLNNISHYVYDQHIHGNVVLPLQEQKFPMLHGVNASWVNYIDPTTQQRFPFAGRPVAMEHPLTPQWITVAGNGVWTSYFEPVSSFSPLDESCTSLPILHLSHAQIVPGLHVHCPWSLRAWRYGGLPPGLRRDELSYQDWLAPMRQRGNELVKKYIRVQPYLQRAADQVNPSNPNNSNSRTSCLALHIRHSDKANRRKRIAVKKFLPFVQAYVEEQLQLLLLDDSRTTTTMDRSIPSGSPPQQMGNIPFVYLATDSHQVIEEIQTKWPGNLVQYMHWQTQVVRSNDTTPVFTLTSSHHVTNVQVLVDILAMAKCQYLLHGLSAVSEATHYFNPILHNQSINLEVLGGRGRRNKKKKQSRQQHFGDTDDDDAVATFRAMIRKGGPAPI